MKWAAARQGETLGGGGIYFAHLWHLGHAHTETFTHLLYKEIKTAGLVWFGTEAAGTNGGIEQGEIALCLVCVGRGAIPQGFIERILGSQIAGDHRRVAGFCMSARQIPAAHRCIAFQRGGFEGFGLGGDLHVAELTDIVIMAGATAPPEKNVARSLHQTQTLYYTETLMREAALALRRFEHRSARFLDLKKERIVLIGEKKRDVAASANATHAHNFYGAVLPFVAIKQFASVLLQRFLVALPKYLLELFEISDIFVEMVDHWRIVLNSAASVYDLTKFGKGRFRRSGAGLGSFRLQTFYEILILAEMIQ